jgi:hypothetical protein
MAARRAATFGWMQTAREHRDVYESLLNPSANGAASPDVEARPPGI